MLIIKAEGDDSDEAYARDRQALEQGRTMRRSVLPSYTDYVMELKLKNGMMCCAKTEAQRSGRW